MTAKSFGNSDSILPFLNPYKYAPLTHSSSQFRIFTLSPSSDRDAELEGTLHIEALDGQGLAIRPYEALSYVWGTEIAASPLFMSGSTQVPITENLAEALRYIRHTSQPRDLWVDALCIDQSNGLEKNHQVRQMYQLYALASRVIIWLGPADEDSKYALSHLELMRTASRRDLSRMATLFQRPWSSRIWTFQEALAANAESIVMCGSTTVPWQNMLIGLRDLLKRARSYPDASMHRLRHFLEVHRLHKTSQKITLEQLILASSNRKATDPRDYVYALLGLINDDSFEGIEPDYTQSASWTFQKAMVSIFKSRKSLDMLVCKTLLWEPVYPLRLELSSTSWCLPFSKRHVFNSFDEYYLNRRFGVMEDGAADGRLPSKIVHSLPRGTIKLTGLSVGIIQRFAHVDLCDDGLWNPLATRVAKQLKYSKRSRCKMILDLIEQVKTTFNAVAASAWKRYDSRTTHRRIADGEVWQLLANGRHMEYLLDRAPMTNGIYSLLPLLSRLGSKWLEERMNEKCDEEDSSFDGGDNLPELFSAHGKACLIKEITMRIREWFPPDLAPSEIDIEAAWDALYRIATKCVKNLGVFTVLKGYAGSGTTRIQLGDILCIIYGCKVPLVLRKDNDGRYIIIEAVYVGGLMGGEYFEDRKIFEPQDFVIK